MTFTRAHYEETADVIRSKTDLRPKVALVLGSGLSGLADSVTDAVSIPYEELPHWPTATVHGHAGRLVIGRIEDQPVLVMQGRAHFYEGYSMAEITLPVRVFHVFGIETLILTNAAGGINQKFKPGDLMLITDHIGLVEMTGINPLLGPNDDSIGPRFPDMTHPYDSELCALAHAIAADLNYSLHEGTYLHLSGPAFETPAEIRFFHMMGADAVGMSTVPSVMVARHAGMRVLGISSITNVHTLSPSAETETNHEEVLEIGRMIVPRLTALLRGILRQI
ncbi:MAG: purine-nucleoside phosphorylase [Anaerolineae bacterium]|nr:purine-nucleoside phosphorylase [Anaerolineae bacterium]MCO5188657.1 purine-nucleoside phosphorylase [Anaerolineae bacterium]MCO5192825.1 purine-nucleoside phosphorylase [Anaerolineae bacterium]MCO5197027.1 purine-nucleoside phosphorylase [Anaerolineae bacterium]MCO5204592.1 purine-nucleoside phosphorylase [Anaerolineae bacterium]